MDPLDLLQRNSSYLVYGTFGLMLLLAIILLSPIALAVSSLSLVVAIVYSKSSHIINPILARKGGMVLVGAGYRLSENPKVAITDHEGGYRAVCVALLIPSSRIANSSEKFEDILAKCRFPFRFEMEVVESNLKAVVEALETKRRIKEIQISKTKASRSDEISRLRRELSIIESELAEITRGRRPTAVAIRIASSSNGGSESAAANAALSQIDQLCVLFSATYNLGHRLLSGEELLRSVVV